MASIWSSKVRPPSIFSRSKALSIRRWLWPSRPSRTRPSTSLATAAENMLVLSSSSCLRSFFFLSSFFLSLESLDCESLDCDSLDCESLDCVSCDSAGLASDTAISKQKETIRRRIMEASSGWAEMLRNCSPSRASFATALLAFRHVNTVPLRIGRLLQVLVRALQEGVRRAVVGIAREQCFELLHGFVPGLAVIGLLRALPLRQQIGVARFVFGEGHQLVDAHRLQLALHADAIERAEDEVVFGARPGEFADDAHRV